MVKKTDMDMTVGNPMKIIVKFTIPLLIGNIFQQFYNIIDTVIVGRFVGKDALAAVGSTGTIMFLVMGIAMGMVTGFSILTSQRYGAKDEDGVKKTLTNGLYLAIVLSIIITTISLLSMRKLLTMMNTPDTIFDYAYAYISTICMGTLTTVSYNFFSALMRAIGNTKMPLVFLVFSACLNIVMDLFFIINLGLETFGAALATVISQAIAGILCAIYIFVKMPVLRPAKKHWKLDLITCKKQILLGIPLAAQNGITASGTVIMQSAINLFGDTAVAAVTAANKIQAIITQGMFTVGQTMPAYVGQNYGSRNMKRIKQGLSAAVKLYIGYSIVAALIAIFSTPVLIRFFFEAGTDMSAYLPYAKIFITECAIFYFPLSLIFIFRNSMQGAGYGAAATTMGMVEFTARIIMSVLSIKLGNFYLAVGADPFAWLSAGIFGVFLARFVFKKLESKWTEKQNKDSIETL